MLGAIVGSVNSALNRARANLQRRQHSAAGLEPPPPSCSPSEDAIVASFELVRTQANSQPAFGANLRFANGTSHGVGLYVVTLSGERICALTRFETSVLPWFGLPRSLPSR